MSKMEAWTITAAIVVVMIAIPARAYRYAAGCAIVVMLLFVFGVAFADDLLSRDHKAAVFFDEGPRIDYPEPKPKVGAVLPFSAAKQIFFLDINCALPMVGAENYRMYWDASGVGCWGLLLDGGYEIVDSQGHTRQFHTYFAASLELATLHSKARQWEVTSERADVKH